MAETANFEIKIDDYGYFCSEKLPIFKEISLPGKRYFVFKGLSETAKILISDSSPYEVLNSDGKDYRIVRIKNIENTETPFNNSDLIFSIESDQKEYFSVY